MDSSPDGGPPDRVRSVSNTSNEFDDSPVNTPTKNQLPSGSALTGPKVPDKTGVPNITRDSSGNGHPLTTVPTSTPASATSSSAATTVTASTNPSLPKPASSSYLLEDAKLRDILMSDVGTDALLKRLKQSIHAAKELSSFLKKSSNLEQEHMNQVRKLAISSMGEFVKPEYRQGTFSGQLNQLIKVNERSCDATRSFVSSLNSMHKELSNLASTVDKSRKSIKETALRNERQLLEAEQQAEKAKSKYDSLCEEFEKVRTGDPSKNKFGFKHSKGAQHEEDLHKKVLLSESDYQQKVDNAQRLRRDQINKNRPAAVKQLKDLILECDSAMSFQLQKYANLHEILALNKGFIVSPLKPNSSASGNLTMKEMAAKIDNELDLYNYVLGIQKTVGRLNRPLITYQRHSTMVSAYPAGGVGGNVGGSRPPGAVGTAAVAGGAAIGAAAGAAIGAGGGALGLGNQTNANTNSANPDLSSTNKPIKFPSVLPPVSTSEINLYPTNHPISPSSTNEVISPEQATPSSAYPPGTTTHSTRSFGTPLDVLLGYEELTVPRVVFQCVQAIDNFGLEVEGIYRTTGNNTQIQEIKRLFDANAAAVDLLHPTAQLNDIHSVAGALKLYFRDLPDPLLTREFHGQFLEAAQVANDEARRDAVHGVVNELPDPNYTTLRHLIFHLSRVQAREASNRMSISNLGIVWGPTLMSTTRNNPEDMAIEARVIETILINAYTIFDAD